MSLTVETFVSAALVLAAQCSKMTVGPGSASCLVPAQEQVDT